MLLKTNRTVLSMQAVGALAQLSERCL